MLLALSWALGHVVNTPYLPLEWMVATHGLANAVGFALCGCAGLATTCGGCSMKLDDLAALRFNYDVVGSTRYDETPEGYHRLEHRARDRCGQ